MRISNSSDAEKQEFETRLQAAQAEVVLSNMGLTLSANIFISTTTALVLWIYGHNPAIPYWLGAVIALAFGRFALNRLIKVRGLYQSRPKAALRALTAAALVSGLSWLPVPLVFADLSSRVYAGYVIFIMAGMATGAIIQSLAYWPPAVAFGLPLMSSTVGMLVANGEFIDYIIATNVLLLTVMLVRASIMGERGFRQSKGTALRALRLAESLSTANKEINRSHRALERVANSDPLTGLSNRVEFNRRIHAACQAAARGENQAALVLFDIDKFKLINDTRGHHIGDMVLRAVAERLESLCDQCDLIVRLGGDEFAILVEGEEALARAQACAEKVMATFSVPLNLAEQPLAIGVSVGIASCPDHARAEDDLYACADLALYSAKEAGRRCIRVFDTALRARLDFQRSLDRDLEAALDQSELAVHFQPQVNLDGKQLVGFEALIRWNHREIGAVNPEAIVATAANLHLLDRLTTYVAEDACRFIRRAEAMGIGDFTVSINMSPREFGLYSPADRLIAIARRHGVDPRRLEVEITEEVLLDPKKVAGELERLQNAGFGIAVDDFGMGHSSFAHLICLKIDRLKVDRSFVRAIESSHHNQALVAAMVSVSRALNLSLVMEGVETEAEAETLRMLGCTIGQGWLYGKAMPVSDALAWHDRLFGRRAVA